MVTRTEIMTVTEETLCYTATNAENMNIFQKIKNLILDILFPPINLESTAINQTLFCPVCRARQARNVKICHQDAPYKLAAAAKYDGQVKDLILSLKYHQNTGALQPLTDLLQRYIKNLKFSSGGKITNYIIIPIPMFPDKERQRGFNQATLIAKEMAKILNLPLIENALVKIRDTKAQADLKDWDERKKNLVGCFEVLRPELINKKNLIIVDDVFTSGATLNEAAWTARKAGARRMIGLVIAKVG